MTPRFALAGLAVLALFGPTLDARAAVVLQSAELTRHSGIANRGGGGSVTDTTAPFPNDANRFAVAGPEGLTVYVDTLSGSYSNVFGNLVLATWNEGGFRVVFDVDEPSPFTVSRSSTFPQDLGSVAIRTEAGGELFNPFLREYSGVLQPGRYTFRGYTAAGSAPVPARFTSVSTMRDVRLTVVPEPAALLLPATLLPCLARRRTPGSLRH